MAIKCVQSCLSIYELGIDCNVNLVEVNCFVQTLYVGFLIIFCNDKLLISHYEDLMMFLSDWL